MLQPGIPRPRRLRKNPVVRDLVRETRLHPADLIHPLFVVDGDGPPVDISSMPGQQRLTIDDLCRE
ncbi:MAG: hypothetical protein R6V45_10410, partial [Oceanipulchritudo sp.]